MDSTLQGKFRKALGAVKDHTSISIAKVGSAGVSEVEIAVVKATSHEETPLEEKYVQELLYLTSVACDHVVTCIATLEKRLRRTSSWIVAIKTLMLAHRLLRDGNPVFEQNLASLRKKGTRVLNVCVFSDEYHSHGWDFSAFVRAYGIYLNERLECPLPSFVPSEPQTSSKDNRTCDQNHRQSSASPLVSGSDGDRSRLKQHSSRRKRKPVKKMRPQELMQKFPLFQRLLERILACKPSGAAKSNRLVLFALQPILRESFLVYSDIRDGMAIMLDAFFDLDQEDCKSALNIYSKAAKQVNELSLLYTFYKSVGVCKGLEYPAVEKISDDMLETMTASLRLRLESAQDGGKKSKPPNAKSVSFQDELERDSAPESKGFKSSSGASHSSRPSISVRNSVKPPLLSKPVTIETNAGSSYLSNEGNESPNLLDFEDNVITTSNEQERKVAFAFVSDLETTANAALNNFFPNVAENGFAMANNLSEGVKGPLTEWELALMDSESDMSRPSVCALAGGFDQLLLHSLYDQGIQSQRQQVCESYSVGSTSSTSATRANFLSVPSLSEAVEMENPFAASLYPPPLPPVQISELRPQQQFLLQEQQQWLQYQQQGTSAGYSATPPHFVSNPFTSPFQSTVGPIPYYGVNSNHA